MTVVIVSKYSGGVYFDHKVDDGTWQRTPIFTYNPDTNSDIATFKFIASPGSRFGIFGKGGTKEFFGEKTTIIITLTNTKGHLQHNNYVMKFSGGYWTNEITFDDIPQSGGQPTPYKDGWFRIYGPVNGRINSGTICLLMKLKNETKWSVISTKIYAKTSTRIAQYVNFGRFYIGKGTMLKCWSSDSDLVLNGTSKIDGSFMINGSIYCVGDTENAPSTTISQPLKLTINPNRTPNSQHQRNI